MDKSSVISKINQPEERRRLRMLRILEIIKNKSPIQDSKLISMVEFETGCAENSIKGILKTLYDIGKIDIKDDMIYFKGE